MLSVRNIHGHIDVAITMSHHDSVGGDQVYNDHMISPSLIKHKLTSEILHRDNLSA